MSALISALLVLASGQEVSVTSAKPEPLSARSIITKAVGFYSQAHSLRGKIMLTQAAMSAKVTIETSIAYKRPQQIAVVQVRNSQEPLTVFLKSDGSKFRYSRPEGRKLLPLVMEEPTTGDKGPLLIDDIFLAFHASLVDQCPILDLAVAWPGHQREVLNTLATLKYDGDVDLNAVKVHHLQGRWRENVFQQASGDYEMFVKDSGEILRFVLRRSFVANRDIEHPILVTSTWDADIKLDCEVPSDLFTLK